jgi:hypothetical protein
MSAILLYLREIQAEAISLIQDLILIFQAEIATFGNERIEIAAI